MVHSRGWQSVCRGRAPCAVFHRIVYAVMPGYGCLRIRPFIGYIDIPRAAVIFATNDSIQSQQLLHVSFDRISIEVPKRQIGRILQYPNQYPIL